MGQLTCCIIDSQAFLIFFSQQLNILNTYIITLHTFRIYHLEHFIQLLDDSKPQKTILFINIHETYHSSGTKPSLTLPGSPRTGRGKFVSSRLPDTAEAEPRTTRAVDCLAAPGRISDIFFKYFHSHRRIIPHVPTDHIRTNIDLNN